MILVIYGCFSRIVLVKLFTYNCRTLTTPVKLTKCLRAIKEHAFEASPYPVIITLEDHLTPNLQAKVAKVEYYFLSTLHALLLNYTI